MIKRLIQRLLGQAEAPAAVVAVAAPEAAPVADAVAVAADVAERSPARSGRGRRAPAASAPGPVAAPAMPVAPAADKGPIPLGQRREIPAAEHGIDARLVDERAAKVVATLQAAGFEAYVVGGAVRDLLVGRRPKDFDVATDATPEQVKALFRRAFIIGRRFRIVHVVFGRGREHEVIEVSTFRAYLDNSEATPVAGNEKTSKAELAGQAHAVDASGRVLRDNVWGPQIEDAARRDFSVNAMYYDPQTQVVVDYHGGLADVRAQVLRLIGDPATRYREDPVRILRAVRFSAKLGFVLEPATRAPIVDTQALLSNVPISRLFDEMVKLLQTGHALASVAQLKALAIQRGIFPVLDAVYDEQRATPQSLAFVNLALADTDRRVAEGKPVAPSFMLACLLWHDVLAGWQQRQAEGVPVVPALQEAVDAVFEARIGDVSGRGKLGTDMREIWMMQPRFERRQPNNARTMVEQPRFRAGFDFLRLRADAGELAPELAEWWEDFSLGGEGDRDAMLNALREAQRAPGGRKPGKSPTRPTPAEAGDGSEADAADDVRDDMQDDEAEEGDVGMSAREPGAAPARKRRRRRRKPGGGGQPATQAAAPPSDAA